MVKPFLSWSTVSLTPAIAIGRRRMPAIMVVTVGSMVLVITLVGPWHQNDLLQNDVTCAKVLGVQ